MTNNRFEVETDCPTVGRAFAEYRRMLDIDPATLSGRSALNCGGGAGSFTATGTALWADAVAVDPLYGPPADALEPGLAEVVDRREVPYEFLPCATEALVVGGGGS